MRRLLPSGIALALCLLAFVATSLLSTSAFAANLLGYQPTDTASLEVVAHLPELAPGRQVHLEVRVTNRGATPFRVSAVDVQVDDAGPGCGAENLTVADLARAYDVAPGQSVVVPVPVTMVDAGTSQDACKGATFPMRYQVSTTPVG